MMEPHMSDRPEAENLDLRPWGYAQGSYFVKCIDCPEKPTTDWPIGDKRSIRCKQHALEARERAPAQPVADAGGVTEGNIELRKAAVRAICRQQSEEPFRHVCTCMEEGGIGFKHVPSAILCRDTYEEIWDALRPVVNQSLAAATAAKDAEIMERLSAARDKMEAASKNEGLSEDQIANIWGVMSGIDAAISIIQQVSALSEAREAGAKD